MNSLNKNVKKNNEYKYYFTKNQKILMAVGFSAVALSGIYYLYKYFFSQEDFTEEQLAILEEIKQDIQNNNNDFSIELATKIIQLVNERANYGMKNEIKSYRKTRIDNITNENQYEKHCKKYLELKENYYDEAYNYVSEQLGIEKESLRERFDHINFDHSFINNFLSKKILFFESVVPDKKTTKEAFIFFGNKYIEEVGAFNAKFSTFENNHHHLDSENKRKVLTFKLLVIKQKAEDFLFMKYGITEEQVRYLLNEYCIIDDKEIKSVNSKILSYEEFFFVS